MKKRQEIYDLYWYFANERQNIFIKKLNGDTPPWTNDPILKTYKFCNSYRVNDRVSQYLLKNVIYNGKTYKDEDMLFRIGVEEIDTVAVVIRTTIPFFKEKYDKEYRGQQLWRNM